MVAAKYSWIILNAVVLKKPIISIVIKNKPDRAEKAKKYPSLLRSLAGVCGVVDKAIINRTAPNVKKKLARSISVKRWNEAPIVAVNKPNAKVP